MKLSLKRIPRFFTGLYRSASAWVEFLKEPKTADGLIGEAIALARDEQNRRLVAEGNEKFWQTHHQRVMALLSRDPNQEVREAARVAEIVITSGNLN